MKKTYISPAINVVKVQTTIMAGSEFGKNETGGDAGSALGRHQSIQWIDDDDEDI